MGQRDVGGSKVRAAEVQPLGACRGHLEEAERRNPGTTYSNRDASIQADDPFRSLIWTKSLPS